MVYNFKGNNNCKVNEFWWFGGRVVSALDYKAGDLGLISGSGVTIDRLFSAGW